MGMDSTVLGSLLGRIFIRRDRRWDVMQIYYRKYVPTLRKVLSQPSDTFTRASRKLHDFESNRFGLPKSLRLSVEGISATIKEGAELEQRKAERVKQPTSADVQAYRAREQQFKAQARAKVPAVRMALDRLMDDLEERLGRAL